MSEGLSSPMIPGEKNLGGKRNGHGADLFGFTQVPTWFDVRVFYVRVAYCPLDDTPDVLTMRYPSRNISTAVEVNGGRIAPSEELKLTLRRDRLDTDSSEATYVSTDNFRASGTVSFEVYDKDLVLLSGTFQRLDFSSDVKLNKPGNNVSKSGKVGWTMDLTCVLASAGCSFLKGRQAFSATGYLAPTMEVTVVGRYAGSPVTLSETLQLIIRKKTNRKHTLRAIDEEDEGRENISSDLLLSRNLEVSGDYANYGEMADKFPDLGNYYDRNVDVYGDSEDGELSWFNAGVRVGVGIGLGMCLGVGIGVGVLVRTYQATTRTFRRNIFLP